MSTHFLAQLAHRALAGSDVRPRTPARFEAPATLVQVERVTEAPAAISETVPAAAPGPKSESPDAQRPTPPPRDPPMPGTRTVTHEEIVDRVIQREVPVLAETSPRAQPATLVREMPLVTHTAPPASPMQSDPRETPRPLLANAAPMLTPPVPVANPSADPPAATRTPAREAAPTAILVAPTLPAMAVPALSVQAAPPPASVHAPIEIVIGRIEIRSDAETPVSRPAPPTAPRRSASTLDTYLRARGERAR